VKEEVRAAVMAGEMTEKAVEMMVLAAVQKRIREAPANHYSRKEEGLSGCLLNRPQLARGHRYLHCHHPRRHGHCRHHRHRQLGAEFSLCTTAKITRANVQNKHWS
jgi:hypothetical protein